MLELLQPTGELGACLLATPGNANARLLTAAGQLLTRIAPSASDFVEEIRSALTRARCRPGGCLQGALDGVTKRLGDLAVGRLLGSLAHPPELMPMLAAVSGHLRPTAEIAPDVILPGDPGRALALAQELLDSPRMSNHSRGLWGYSGNTAAGLPLTIQATGIGGPSLAVVVEELAEFGARRLIRLGTCRALHPEIEAGDVLVVNSAVAAEGASRALGAGAVVEPDARLTAALRLGADGFSQEGGVISTDLLYGDADAEAAENPEGQRAIAADLGTATLFALGGRPGLAVAAGLVVTGAGEKRLSDEQLAALSLRLGRAAAGALAALRR